MSHFAFVNPGGPQVPPLAPVTKHKLTRLYWQANDVQISAGLFQGIRDNPKWDGVEFGLLRDPIWGTLTNVEYDAAKLTGKSVMSLDAPTLATTMSKDITRLGFDNKQGAALADIEWHDAAYVVAFLHEWRALRPLRVTGWTLEPHQGGWFDPNLVRMLMQSKVTVFPQAYLADETPVDVDVTRCDLIERGLPRGMVAACYSAVHIPILWDGIAFRFDQLP